MASAIVTAIFSWFHIISAMGWFGSLAFMAFALLPALGKVSSEARYEVLVHILPRASMLVRAFGGLAIIVGVIYAGYLSMTGALSAMTSPYSISLATGAIIALITFGAFGEGMMMPASRKFVSEYSSGKKDSLGPLENRIRQSAILQILLLGVVLAAMVTAGAL